MGATVVCTHCIIDIGITGLATPVKNLFDARHGHIMAEADILDDPCSRKLQNDLRKLKVGEYSSMVSKHCLDVFFRPPISFS